MTCVPDSKFVLISLDFYGVIVYHTGRNQIIYDLDLTELMSKFKDQEELSERELRVWDVTVHYPNHIYVFTNRGFVIF